MKADGYREQTKVGQETAVCFANAFFVILFGFEKIIYIY
jgi:hypothetical protein